MTKSKHMKAHVKDICYTAREICKGSGYINLLTIAGLTVIVHLAWLILINRNLFYFFTGIKGSEDYMSINDYISA
ncbi:MAG TPA: hypothetical protein PKA53_12550, partial [Sphingobacterium sp.]|nr:hypothetical protein [Sphingobacterium sp.]